MHELFTQVLNKKDLSKAGDLFSVADQAIVNDLTEVLNKIEEIINLPDYINNDNDQSVVEICITRVTSAIRETGSIEQHAEALVSLLEACLMHNLKPSHKDEDPPHAKISSDIISCIFQNYSKKHVMKRALPVAVKFLHKGNKELSRNMSSYLALAAIENADLLSKHVQLVIDSIISGNYSLCRVLPQIYAVNKEPLHDHVMALVTLLPQCENTEKLSLLNLFALIAKGNPSLLEPSLPQLCEHLNATTTAMATMQIFLHIATSKPQLLVDYVSKVKTAAEYNPNTLCIAAQIISSVGKLSKDRAQEALNFVLEHLPKADCGSQTTLLREATLLCSSYPVLFTEKIIAEVRQCGSKNHINNRSPVTSGGVTIVKVGGGGHTTSHQAATLPVNRYTTVNGVVEGNFISRQEVNRLVIGRPRLGDSRSTGRLHSSTAHKSMTRLNIGGSRVGSIGGLHKSMTRLSSSQQLNSVPTTSAPVEVVHNNKSITMISGGGRHYSVSAAAQQVFSGGVTVTTATSNKSVSGLSTAGREDKETVSVSTTYPLAVQHTTPLVVQAGGSRETVSNTANNNTNVTGIQLGQSNTRLNNVTPSTRANTGSTHTLHSTVVTSRRANTSVTIINSPSNAAIEAASQLTRNWSEGVTFSSLLTLEYLLKQKELLGLLMMHSVMCLGQCFMYMKTYSLFERISVFEPYPMRDTIQHFCEKHLDKIKSYMEKVSTRIPSPAKCTIEELRNTKKLAKLHFACQGRGEHCLYNRTFFTLKTRSPRTWIHLMFLALQARSDSALSSRDTSVSSLKNCWDILKCENKSFLTVVTSAFPTSKDQELLLNELRHSGFFDVFESTSANDCIQWGCFLCNHPERAIGFLQDSQPVIEGQLKEKKGRWKIFKRWRTRYFTLSGAHLSYKGSKDDKDVTPIEVNQIRSVKVSRGARNIPKAFEIFTGDQSLILKPKGGKNAEEWVQCLSIVVAHSHSREMPVKSNSLPARGASLRTAV